MKPSVEEAARYAGTLQERMLDPARPVERADVVRLLGGFVEVLGEAQRLDADYTRAVAKLQLRSPGHLEAETERLRAELDIARVDLAKRERFAGENAAALASAQAEAVALAEANTRLRGELTTAQDTLDHLRRRESLAKSRLEQAEAARADEGAELRVRLAAAEGALEEQTGKSTAALGRMLAAKTAAEAESSATEGRLAAAYQDLDTLRRTAALAREVATRKASELEADVERLTAALATSEASLEDLRRQLATWGADAARRPR